MADGSVIVCWNSNDEKSDISQAELFKDLKAGGQLPKLPAEIYALKSSDLKNITYNGYHLAYTQKNGKFYEWSIYVPDEKPVTGKISGYQLLHRYNPESRIVRAKIGLSMAAELTIENAEDFDILVRGAMADLSDNGTLPENLTYDYILQLVNNIRKSQIK